MSETPESCVNVSASAAAEQQLPAAQNNNVNAGESFAPSSDESGNTVCDAFQKLCQETLKFMLGNGGITSTNLRCMCICFWVSDFFISFALHVVPSLYLRRFFE